MTRLIAAAFGLVLCAGAALAQDARFVYPGWARYLPTYAREGMTVGDFNADGIPDVAVVIPSLTYYYVYGNTSPVCKIV